MAITRITPREENAFKSCIAPYTYEVKDQNTATATVVIRADNAQRKNVKKDVESKLTAKSYVWFEDTGGSIGVTKVEIGGKYQIKITYKALSGGMSETTLNSTITELAPALAFMANKKEQTSINFLTHTAFHNFLCTTIPKNNKYGCYINEQDKKAGQKFIEDMPTSSKFKEKLENAMAILDYLKKLDGESPIKQVYFAYRAKPREIPLSHKGDLFVQFENDKWLGVSLKAGGETTSEPQLNTYVNKLYDDFGYDLDKTKLINKVYEEIHKPIGLDSDWASRSKRKASVAKITAFKNSDPKKYESEYDKMLEMCRDAVIDAVNKDLEDAKKYITNQVLGKDENVPLVVVKAFGKQYMMVTDEDKLDKFLPKATSIVASKSATSKQDWFITLKDKKNSLVMKMSIRSNKPIPDNKIAQGFNLAIKFNGLRK